MCPKTTLNQIPFGLDIFLYLFSLVICSSCLKVNARCHCMQICNFFNYAARYEVKVRPTFGIVKKHQTYTHHLNNVWNIITYWWLPQATMTIDTHKHTKNSKIFNNWENEKSARFYEVHNRRRKGVSVIHQHCSKWLQMQL